MASQVGLILLTALGIALTGPTAWAQSDQDLVDQAVNNLASSGVPPPAGFDITAADPGQLPNGRIAQVDDPFPPGEILVNVPDLRDDFPNASDGELVKMIEVGLNHEYLHTTEYGGFGQTFCSHFDLFDETLDHLCEVIEQEQFAGNDTEDLCRLANDLTNARNGTLPARNAACPGTLNVRFLCGAC